MKKKKIAVLASLTAVAVCAASMGYALWSTSISGSGNVTASGNWDVNAVSAGFRTSSSGAEITPLSVEPEGGYKFESVSNNSLYFDLYVRDNSKELGEVSDVPLDEEDNFYLVDGSKYSWNDVNATTSYEELDVIKNDATSVKLSDYMYKYYDNGDDAPDGLTTAAYFKNLFYEDLTELIKELHPDTYMNYYFADFTRTNRYQPYFPTLNTLMAEMSDPAQADYTVTDEAITYANVTFSIPGAWAEYSLTVTNEGTADANLDDIVFDFESENSAQLEVDLPELTNEVLAPGESCTLTAVVKAVDDGSDTLNAEGRLTITLPYEQDIVEEAPSASHQHAQ